MDKRRHPFVDGNDIFGVDRQKLVIAPHGLWAPGERFEAETSRNCVVIIDRLEI